MGLAWRVISGFPLHRRQWGTHCVIFHEGSGDTHVMPEFGDQVLLSLQDQGPADLDTLGRRLETSLNLEWSATLASRLDTLLHELDELGLIEPCQ